MILKAFISHSSKQKHFAEAIRNCIGADYCWIDKYDFEPSYKTLSEIYDKLGKTSIFVLLISKEAIKSDWVQTEIAKAKELLNQQHIDLFSCYIIDDTQLSDLPNWMVKDECYNLKHFSNPIFVAHDIKKKMMRILLKNDSLYQLEQQIFVGRNDKINEFETKMYSSSGASKLAMIISGRKGVGKKKFAMKCLEDMGMGNEIIPFSISMDSKHSIEDFIILLNSKTMQYDEDYIYDILAGSFDDKLACAVCLIGEIYQSHSYIFINDDKCIVRPERRLSEWFTNILSHPKFPQKLGIFVFSAFTPNIFVENDWPCILHIKLNALSKSDCTKLFFRCLQLLGIYEINQEDANFFIEKLVASPRQIFRCALELKKHPVNLVKKDISSLIDHEDRNISIVLKDFFNDSDTRDIIILLSKYEYLSYAVLQKIFADRIDVFNDCLTKLIVCALVETFGPGDEYIKLDYSYADYIRRNRLKMSPDLEIHSLECITESLTCDAKITEDLSLYLFEIKDRLSKGNIEKNTLLVPSIVIKYIIDIYDKQKWKQVVDLCDKVLNDSYKLSFYQDVIREIRYWLCLSLCRLQNERFFQEVHHFSGADYNFLMGFYMRNETNYPSAEKYYTKALEYQPKLAKALRELVTVMLAQRRFKDALELAKNNYLAQPSNTYHIHAYFRCLVREREITSTDRDILRQLIDEMDNSQSPKKMSLIRAMKLEYDAFASEKKIEPGRLIEDANNALREFPSSVDVQRVVNAIHAKQGICQLKSFDEDPEVNL